MKNHTTQKGGAVLWIVILLIIIIGAIILVLSINHKPTLSTASTTATSTTSTETGAPATNLVTISDSVSGISVRVPASSTQSKTADGQTDITLGAPYYASFGFSTTTVKYLTDTQDNQIIFGVADIDSDYCSLQSYNVRGGVSTSMDTEGFNGATFYKVENTGEGMNQYEDVTNFVQPVDGNECRFVEFNGHATNPGVFNADYYDPTDPTYQKIHAELAANKTPFYSESDLQNSITITN